MSGETPEAPAWSRGCTVGMAGMLLWCSQGCCSASLTFPSSHTSEPVLDPWEFLTNQDLCLIPGYWSYMSEPVLDPWYSSHMSGSVLDPWVSSPFPGAGKGKWHLQNLWFWGFAELCVWSWSVSVVWWSIEGTRLQASTPKSWFLYILVSPLLAHFLWPKCLTLSHHSHTL